MTNLPPSPALVPIGEHGLVAPADINLVAQAYGLRTSLIRAFVEVESGGDPTAYNPEPKYRYYWNCATKKPFRRVTDEEVASEIPPADFPACPGLAEQRDAEWWGQAASWGPMQIMGACAREAGFLRAFPALCDPYVGLQQGCHHLLAVRHHYFSEYGWEGVVAAYNAGSPRREADGKWANQGYVDAIRKAGGFEGLE